MPKELEMPGYLLQLAQAVVSIGKKQQTNIKVCDGHCMLNRCLEHPT